MPERRDEGREKGARDEGVVPDSLVFEASDQGTERQGEYTLPTVSSFRSVVELGSWAFM